MTYEPAHHKTCKMTCVPNKDSDQPGHLPSLIRVFAVCMKKAWAFNYPLSTPQRLCSDWAAQADLSLRWVHMPFCWFCHALTHIPYPHPPNSKNMLLFTNNKRPCQTNFHCSSYSTIKGASQTNFYCSS